MPGSWDQGDAYEAFMGRWSRRLAQEFISWLSPAAGLAWLDIGCGTGALTSAILKLAHPASVVACDPSEEFISHLRTETQDPRVTTVVADADAPPERDEGFDVVAAGLVINFVPDPLHAIRAMSSRASTGGVVAGYVWDYADKMEFLRYFWDAAVALDPTARQFDEGVRWPLCRQDAFAALFRDAGLVDVTPAALEIDTRFESFGDYWEPFLGRTGPAGSYVASLDGRARDKLRDRLEAALPIAGDGTIELVARAWAVRGRRDDDRPS